MASTEDDALPPLLPEPWRAQRTPGCLSLAGPVTVIALGDAGAAEGAAELLVSEFRARGILASTLASTPTTSEATSTSVSVSVTVSPGSTPSLHAMPLGASEGYELEITPVSLSIRACSPAGAFYAVQTLRQLLPAKTKGRRKKDDERQPLSLSLPCLEVADAPRFAWRGLLLDVARHFFDARFVERLVDVAASLKLNVLHLHLVDDQGWRLPSTTSTTKNEQGKQQEEEQRREKQGGENASSFCDSFPLLSRVGAWRGDSRREAREWRAARRRRRREMRRRRGSKEKKGEEEKGEQEQQSDEGEISGASPSSEASSDDGSESDDFGESAAVDGGEAKSRKASPDRRRRVRAGGFYCLRDLSKILDAAAARHVTVVPEADLPGHCGAAIACYPRLACGGSGGATAAADNDDDDRAAAPPPAPPPPASAAAVPTLFGVHSHVLCASSEFSSSFAGALLSDVATRLFPRSPFVHVGGDEVPRGPWEGCPGCRERSRELMLRAVVEELRKNEKGEEGDAAAAAVAAASLSSASSSFFCGDLLHSWFISQAEETLRKHGRRAVAWCDAFDARESARAAVASAVAEVSSSLSSVGKKEEQEEEQGRDDDDSAFPPRYTPSPLPIPSSDVVVMCWRGGGSPGARAAASGKADVVMCPASRCYLDYRNDDVPGEPGAWYAKLTLRECWEFDPLVVDEAVEVEEEEEGDEKNAEDVDEKKEKEEVEGTKRHGGGGGGTPAAAAGEEGVRDAGGATHRPRSASSSMAEVEESRGPSGADGGGGDERGNDDDVVSSVLVPPRPASSPPRDAPHGASLAMASSGGAATMSGEGAFGGAAAGGGDEEEVSGPVANRADVRTGREDVANQASPERARRRAVVLRRVPLPEASHARVLGGQACLWTEYCPDEATAEHLLFPRLLAISEALWSRPLRERRASAKEGAASTGEGDAGVDESSSTGAAWMDFVERARALSSRLECEGWRGRKF